VAQPIEANGSSVSVPIDGLSLDGSLVLPEDARGVVLFAHGSGSSRHSRGAGHIGTSGAFGGRLEHLTPAAPAAVAAPEKLPDRAG